MSIGSGTFDSGTFDSGTFDDLGDDSDTFSIDFRLDAHIIVTHYVTAVLDLELVLEAPQPSPRAPQTQPASGELSLTFELATPDVIEPLPPDVSVRSGPQAAAAHLLRT